MDKTLQSPIINVISRRNIVSVRELDPIALAVHYMDQQSVSALPVINTPGTGFAGVLSTTDIASERFMRLVSERTPEHILVNEVMNRNLPISVNVHQTVAEAIAIMHKRHIHRVFVTDENHQIYGILSTTDILRLLFLEPTERTSHSVEEQRQFLNHVRDRHERFMEDTGWKSL